MDPEDDAGQGTRPRGLGRFDRLGLAAQHQSSALAILSFSLVRLFRRRLACRLHATKSRCRGRHVEQEDGTTAGQFIGVVDESARSAVDTPGQFIGVVVEGAS